MASPNTPTVRRVGPIADSFSPCRPDKKVAIIWDSLFVNSQVRQVAAPSITKIALLAESEKESTRLDFKAGFDDSKKDWCEILKDIVAMANTRGGMIIFGIDDDGKPSGIDIAPVYRLDPATVTDKIASYTGVQFADLILQTIERFGSKYPAIVIGRAKTPLVFFKPGTYPVPGQKASQKTAFSQGTVYVRHGAKSEPATSDDLRQFIDRRLEQMARAWRRGIRRVITAPVDYEVQVVPPNMKLVPDEEAQEIRLVNDDSAPAARFLKPDETHPYRQKELVPQINKRLDGKVRVTSYHIQCVRRIHNTDGNPTFSYASKYGSRQYSTAFADWIIEQYTADAEFFKKACAESHRQQAEQRINRKPR